MARTKISEFSATAADNTDIDNIDIAEGCAPSGINNAIRELMAQLKDFQTGAAGDPFNGAVNGTVGATTPAAGAFTTLSASSTVSGTGFSNYFASPPAIGGTAAAAGTFTNLAYTGTLTGGTGVINIGSGQVYKDASGNVGIGTSSPRNKLDVAGGVITGVGNISGQADNSAFSIWGGHSTLNGSYVQLWGASSANPNLLIFGNSNTERMRLDASGNLGLGVNPSAWAAGKTAIEMPGGISLSQSGGYTQLSNNAFLGASSWIYKANGQAALYNQHEGKHLWYTAPSGTAGNTVSFTQAMTLDASGNLALGQTSASYKLDVNTTGGSVATARLLGNDQANVRLRFENSGGRTWELVGGLPGANNTNFSLRDVTGGTTPLTVDSSGNLLVGTTTTSIAGSGAYFSNIGQLNLSQGSGGGFAQFKNNVGTVIGSISNSANTSTAYNTTSDYRLKENVAPMQNALDFVRQQRPVTYTWKADGSAAMGYIAHWMEEDGAGQCVTGEKDAVDEEGNPKYQGIDTSFMVAPLNAAIKELADMFDQLKAEFDAYKAAHP